MRIIRDYQFAQAGDRGASAAIGNFDGVHRGHRAVIELAQSAAPDLPLGVVTFEPHPREYFAPDAPSFRLMSAGARAARLEKLGVNRLYQLNFNGALAALAPRDFASRVIADGLGLAHVVVGSDFRFGQGRGGTVTDLRSFGEEMGFGVTVADLLGHGDQQISSTAIRSALAQGRPRDAADLLGHWHRIEGKVIGGEQRGRELGFPTANMSIDGLAQPKFGVYAVLVDIRTGPHAGSYHGAASVGTRPMFDGQVPNIETYLFDFTGDIYGETLSVALVDYLRPEMRFTSLEALIEQMQADCVMARQILSAP